MQISKSLAYAAISFALSHAALSANAQQIEIPADAEFAVRVELDAIRETNLGKQLIKAVKSKAAEEFGNGKKPDDAFDAIEEALGFDPFDELKSVSVFGHEIANPAEKMQIVVGMRRTTGNLEGLILALPGYESSQHGDTLIHSVSPEGNARFYGAVHGKRSKRVVVGTDLDGVRSVLDSLNDQGAASPSDSAFSQHADALVRVQLNRIPEIDDLEGPPQVIAKLLKHVSATIRAGSDGNLNVDLTIKTDDEKHAEQLQQLTQGLAAMVSLIQNSDEADEDLEIIADIVDGMKVKRDRTSIDLHLEVPEDLVVGFLRDEADLSLSH